MKREQMKVVVVAIGDPPEVMSITPTLEVYQRLVGGDIEAVPLGPGCMYIHAEGKWKELHRNQRATALAAVFGSLFEGDYIAGDTVLVGPPDRDGDEQDAPAEFIRWAEEQTR